MEDAYIAELDLGDGVSFFGVYDGHGGKNHFGQKNETLVRIILRDKELHT